MYTFYFFFSPYCIVQYKKKTQGELIYRKWQAGPKIYMEIQTAPITQNRVEKSRKK